MTGAGKMKTLKFAPISLVLFMLPACGKQLVEFANPGGPDAGKADSRNLEVRNTDGVAADTRSPDLASPDVGVLDIRSPDTSNSDIASPDATAADTRSIDATNLDLMKLDVGNTDSRNPDIGNPDVGTLDVRIIDATNLDTAMLDVASIDTPKIDATTVDTARIDAATIDIASIDTAKLDTVDIDAGDIDARDIDAQDIDAQNIGPQPAIVINLGLAAPFAIAATAGVTNTITAPITHINGDVVLDPNKTCNAIAVDNAGGFGLCDGMPPVISGMVITNLYPDTTTSTAIKASLNAAFLSITPLAGPPAVGSLGGGTPMAAPTTLGAVAGSALVLGDNWFTPGVYISITSILISDDITLDGQGDPNAQFIFQSASTLTTADGAPSPGAHARVLLTNGAKASNVWWQVASSATIGSYAEFQGNILAAFSITMKTGATACGRSMAGAWVGGTGAFVFDSNVVSVPGNGCPL
jgi:hypothetical protein